MNAAGTAVTARGKNKSQIKFMWHSGNNFAGMLFLSDYKIIEKWQFINRQNTIKYLHNIENGVNIIADTKDIYLMKKVRWINN